MHRVVGLTIGSLKDTDGFTGAPRRQHSRTLVMDHFPLRAHSISSLGVQSWLPIFRELYMGRNWEDPNVNNLDLHLIYLEGRSSPSFQPHLLFLSCRVSLIHFFLESKSPAFFWDGETTVKKSHLDLQSRKRIWGPPAPDPDVQSVCFQLRPTPWHSEVPGTSNS